MHAGLSAVLSVALCCGAAMILAAGASLGLLAQVVERQDNASDAPSSGSKAAFGIIHIILSGGICFVMYLTEGMVMDWGGIFLMQVHEVGLAAAPLCFVILELCIGLMRLGTDALRRRCSLKVLLSGGILGAACCLGLIPCCGSVTPVLLLTALLGLCIAGAIPLIVSLVGQSSARPSFALSVVSVMGYAGTPAGPASLGPIAQYCGVQAIFVVVALLMLPAGAAALILSAAGRS